MGEKGEGFAGAIIKHTWAITRCVGEWKWRREEGRTGGRGRKLT